MKNILLLLPFILLSLSLDIHTPSFAQADPETESGAVVCAPDVYFAPPSDCLPLGPSAYITEMAKLGLTFPPRPLSVRKPDANLTHLPYRYFHLEEDYLPVLNSPAGTEISAPYQPGFVYVTYIDRVDTGRGIYYMLPNGSWIPGKGARV